ncbi:MAG: hypothetical protein ACO1N0_13050 [Fluviicola sp.]
MKLTFKKWILFSAAIIFILTAYFSVGYYHADEHYQIIEFAGLKTGMNAPGEMPWEFHAQIRSALLPTLAYWIFEMSSFFQMTDTYLYLFILRLISGFSCLFALVFFFRKSGAFVLFSGSDSFLRTSYFILLLLSWYIPFLSVRFSSETWSAIFLLLGLGFYFEIAKNRSIALVVGILFGLSFLFRFQIAFGLIGVGAYHLICGQQKLRTTLGLLSGFSLVLLAGVLIDRWFYSEWVFTPWNYFWLFFENDVLNQTESSFGTSSGFYYLETLYQLPTHFAGVVILASFIIVLIFRPRNPVTWFVLPFALIHSLIAHKEERFLFPIVFLVPFFILSAFSFLTSTRFKKIFKPIVYGTLFCLFFIHSVGLFYMTPKSAGHGRNEITQYIHTHYGSQKIHLINTPAANPYNPWGSLPTKIYLEKHIQFLQVDNLAGISDSMFKPDYVNLLVLRGYDIDHNYLPGNIDRMGFRLEIQSISKKEQSMNRYVKGFVNAEVIYLYKWERK